ncbi:MAG: DMT family transporter [Deltaproteobacteria bacterium]|nr:DMT family transporter [Deltaproteobacteria bacterium]
MEIARAYERPASSRAGVGIILASSVLFGAMAVLVRAATREMPALQIAFVRFLGSFLVLLVVSGGRKLRPRAGNLRRLLQRGLLGGSAICLYYLGIQGAGAGLATLLHCTYPVWTALIAGIFLGETVTRSMVLALVLNAVGVVVVVGPGAHFGSQATWGAISALMASVLAGGAVATARHLRASEDALLITTYFMGVGAALTFPSMIFGVHVPSLFLLVLLVGVVATSVTAQWLLHHGLGFTSATQGSLAAATSTFSAAAFEALALHAYPGSHTLIGAGFMILAVGMAVRPR